MHPALQELRRSTRALTLECQQPFTGGAALHSVNNLASNPVASAGGGGGSSAARGITTAAPSIVIAAPNACVPPASNTFGPPSGTADGARKRAPVHYEYIAVLTQEVAEMKVAVSARKAAVLRSVVELLDPTWGTRAPPRP